MEIKQTNKQPKILTNKETNTSTHVYMYSECTCTLNKSVGLHYKMRITRLIQISPMINHFSLYSLHLETFYTVKQFSDFPWPCIKALPCLLQ